MKKVSIKILSVLLCAACLFGLFSCYTSFIDIMDDKDYWEDLGRKATEKFDKLDAGITTLAGNEQTYVEGVATYESGAKTYEDGVKTYNDNKKTYDDGVIALEQGKEKLETSQKTIDDKTAQLEAAHKQYEDGLAQLEAGKALLEEGKAQLEEGKKTLEAGKAELEEGKKKVADGEAQLAKAESIYNLMISLPSYKNYVKFRDLAIEAENAGDTDAAKKYANQRDWYEGIVNTKLGSYSIKGIVDEYEAGKAQLEEGKRTVAEGEATIAKGEALIAENEKKIADSEALIAANQKKLDDAKKTLEENDKKLAEANEQLQAGYNTYNENKEKLDNGAVQLSEGEKKLKEGAAQLVEGLEKLGEFEGGVEQLAAGLEAALEIDTWRDTKGNALIPSITERLGEGFTFWKLDEEGNVVTMNDKQYVDLEKASVIVVKGREFLDNTIEIVTEELVGRGISLGCLLLGCVFGLITAILGLTNARGTWVLSLITVLFAAAGLVVTYIKGTECPLSLIAGSTKVTLILELAILAGVALVLTVIAIAFMPKKQTPAPAFEEAQ